MNKTWVGMVSTTTVLALFATAGCGSPSGAAANGSSGASSSSNSEPQLIMATSADYPPYEFHDTSSGADKIEGFDIDIANQIAKDLHFQFTVKDMDFNGLVGSLQSKRADFVIAGMTPTPDREKNVDFSVLYYQAQDAIVDPKGGQLTNAASLVGKKVGVQTGSTQETEAKAMKGVNVVSLDTIPQIIEELKTKRIDAAIIESTVAQGFVGNNPDLEMNLLPAQADNGSAIAFPKGSKWVGPFNQELKKMQQDGEMKQLIIKWFGGQQKK